MNFEPSMFFIDIYFKSDYEMYTPLMGLSSEKDFLEMKNKTKPIQWHNILVFKVFTMTFDFK